MILSSTATLRKKRNCCVFEANKVLFHFLRCAGMLPFSKDENGNIKFSMKSLSMLWWVIINGGFVIISIVITVNMIFDIRHAGTEDKIIAISSALFSVAFLVNACLLFDMNQIVKYMEEWKAFQIRFKAVGGHFIRLDNKRSQVGYVSLLIVLAGSSGFNSRFLILEIGKRNGIIFSSSIHSYLILASYATIVVLSAWGFWWYLLSTIRQASDQLLKSFKESADEVDSINTFRRMWRDLRELCTGMTEASSSSLMIYIFLGYFGTIFGWFVTVSADTGNITLNVCMAIITTRFISLIPESCHRTTIKVSSEFQKEIISKRRTVLNGEIEQALNSFEKSIIDFPPNFVVGGYVTLNRNFNITVFMNCAQALTIIYQLKTNVPSSTENSS